MEHLSSLSNSNKNNDLSLIPPHNAGAEQAILGSLLLNNELFYELQTIITSTDFYIHSHQIIYEAILSLISSQRPADLLTVEDELNKIEELERVGGKSYLIEIISNTPAVTNVVHYAEIIRSKSVMRQLYSVGQKISQLAYTSGKKKARDILDEAEQLIFNIAEQTQRHQSSLIPIRETLGHLMQRLQTLFSSPNNGITGVATGFYDLDHKTSGLQSGDLIVIAGRPSMGKTAFAVNIAEFCALQGKSTVAIFSMEMPAEQVATRMISSKAEISLSKLRNGDFKESDHYRFSEAYDSLKEAKIFIDETGGLTALEIKAKVRRLKRQHPDLSLVVIDYIQLMSGSGKGDNRNAELSEISRALKALAKEVQIPIIALSQLSRNVETRADKRPVMSDLRDSGAIEQDADLIIFMYRDSYYTEDKEQTGSNFDQAEAIIRKHRNGALGTIDLIFKGEFTKFLNLNKIEYPDLG
ncbi:MAG: replicative DNA helicase [Neisseriaceae bacterium]